MAVSGVPLNITGNVCAIYSCTAFLAMQTLRTLLELSPTDEDKFKLYQQAKELLAGLPGSAYPDRELQWLVSTCWNRGAHQAKFLRCEAAERYMRLALGLLEQCHSLSGRKQVGVIHPFLQCFGKAAIRCIH
jgi:hypothetical protein